MAADVASSNESAASAATALDSLDSNSDGAQELEAQASEASESTSHDAADSLDLVDRPAPKLSPQDAMDFLLHPVELAKGKRAAENYLSSFRSEDTRKLAEEALETLATVISGGKCDSVEFPWQQVRPYHGAAALTILKAKGAPARIEALRCRADLTRGYRVVPEAYPPRQVQKIRSTLTKVIEECADLGFMTDEEREDRLTAAKSTASKSRKPASSKAAPKGRLLGDGELRALVAASIADGGAEGVRDAMIFSLAYRGLKIAEITALTPESIKFVSKTGACNILAKPSRGGGRGRRVELTNDELIYLEDWLDHRGDGKGPMLCTIGRANKVEGKRLTTAMLTEICLKRAEQAQVPEFTPSDLSRSAEALTDHRKAAKRKAARLAQETLTTAEHVLYDRGGMAPEEASEAIQFPFRGLKA